MPLSASGECRARCCEMVSWRDGIDTHTALVDGGQKHQMHPPPNSSGVLPLGVALHQSGDVVSVGVALFWPNARLAAVTRILPGETLMELRCLAGQQVFFFFFFSFAFLLLLCSPLSDA